MAYTIDKVGISVLFVNDQFKSLNYLDVVRTLIPDIENRNPYHLNNSRYPTLKSIVRITRDGSNVKGFANIKTLYRPSKSTLLHYDGDKD